MIPFHTPFIHTPLGDVVLPRGWTHEMCWDCWWDRYPVTDVEGELTISRWPTRLKLRQTYACCFCGQPNRSGIYMRASPNDPDMACFNAQASGPPPAT